MNAKLTFGDNCENLVDASLPRVACFERAPSNKPAVMNGKYDSIKQPLRIVHRRGSLRRHYPRNQDPIFGPCRRYFETVFIAVAFALREVLAVRPFLAIARATRVTLLITFALDNGEALTVRTGAISYEHLEHRPCLVYAKSRLPRNRQRKKPSTICKHATVLQAVPPFANCRNRSPIKQCNFQTKVGKLSLVEWH